MTRCIIARISVLIAGFAGLSLAVAQATSTTAFVDVTVFSMTGPSPEPHQTVIVAGTTIQAIGSVQTVRVPPGAYVIDGQDRFLIPGLVDSHVHLWGYSRAGEGDPFVERAVLNLLLAHGVTTAIVMEGSPASLAVRAKVANGAYLGPRIYSAGPLIQAANTGAPPHRQTFSTPAEMVAEVSREKAAGFDFVKVHGGMSSESYQALLATARRVGLPVIGHVPDNLGIDAALAGDQRQITHAESYLQTYFEFNRRLPTDPTELEGMVSLISEKTKKAGVYVAPTLSVFHQIITQIADADTLLARAAVNYLPAFALSDWRPPNNPYLKNWTVSDIPHLQEEFSVLKLLVAGLHKAGVPMLAGTDDMVPLQLPGSSLQDEFELLYSAGLTPREVLETATVNAARFLDKPEVSGTIEVGKTADLVLLDANPLDDVDNVFRQEGLMLRGKWYSEAWLQAQLVKAGAP